MSATCPHTPRAHVANYDQPCLSPVGASHAPDMVEDMTSTRTPRTETLIRQGLALEPAERCRLIRALVGDDGLRGAIETAAELNVAQSNLRPIPGLPTPVQTLRCGSIWLTEEVNEFANEYRERRLARVG